MTSKTYQMETLTCGACAAKIQGILKKSKGVQDAEVLFNSSRAKVTFDESVVESDEVKKIIEAVGYKVLNVK